MSYEDFLTRIEKLDLQAILSQIETDIASRNLQVVGWWVKYLAQSKVPPPPKYKPVSYVNNLIGNDFTKHGKECYQIEKSNVLLSMAYTKTFDDWYDRREKLTNAMNSFADAPIYIDDTGSMSVLDIKAKCRRLAMEEKNLGLVVIDFDYFQLMVPTQTKNDNQQ
jgi:hypothetical protein